jgi:hypothetical protein
MPHTDFAWPPTVVNGTMSRLSIARLVGVIPPRGVVSLVGNECRGRATTTQAVRLRAGKHPRDRASLINVQAWAPSRQGLRQLSQAAPLPTDVATDHFPAHLALGTKYRTSPTGRSLMMLIRKLPSPSTAWPVSTRNHLANDTESARAAAAPPAAKGNHVTNTPLASFRGASGFR